MGVRVIDDFFFKYERGIIFSIENLLKLAGHYILVAIIFEEMTKFLYNLSCFTFYQNAYFLHHVLHFVYCILMFSIFIRVNVCRMKRGVVLSGVGDKVLSSSEVMSLHGFI